MCVAKPPSAPTVLTWCPAPIGPPVGVACSASSTRDNGLNLPALSPAGRASPFSHSIASLSISQIFDALSLSISITWFVDSVTTNAEANNTRLPPVKLLNPIVAVSPISTDTLLTSIPRSSAVIFAIDALEPPISGCPVVTATSVSYTHLTLPTK